MLSSAGIRVIKLASWNHLPKLVSVVICLTYPINSKAEINLSGNVSPPGLSFNPILSGTSILNVGPGGAGSLSVSEGSHVQAGLLRLGALATGNGTVVVSGPGSSISLPGMPILSESNINNRLEVGQLGQGVLIIENGAQIDASVGSESCDNLCNPIVANGGGAKGTITVRGAGSELKTLNAFVVAGGVVVGDFGVPGALTEGALNVRDGGRVTGTLLNVAASPNALGTVIVAGEGSSIEFSDATVGLGGNGSLTVSDGGKITIQPAGVHFGSVGVAPFIGATGSVTVDGVRSVLSIGSFLGVSSNFSLNEFGQDPLDLLPDINPGTGTVTVLNGGRIETGLGLFVGNGGTLGGNGTVTGGVSVAEGGTLSPGLSPGTLHIDGDLNLSYGGKLVIEIKGDTPGLFDLIEVSGKIIAGGILEIRLLDGFTPDSSDDFAFLRAANLEGTFANVILPTFGNGQSLQLNVGANGISATVVPVPGAIWLLGSALGGIGLMHRRTGKILRI